MYFAYVACDVENLPSLLCTCGFRREPSALSCSWLGTQRYHCPDLDTKCLPKREDSLGKYQKDRFFFWVMALAESSPLLSNPVVSSGQRLSRFLALWQVVMAVQGTRQGTGNVLLLFFIWMLPVYSAAIFVNPAESLNAVAQCLEMCFPKSSF